MLEKFYKLLDRKIEIIENELRAIKEFRPFAFASIIQSFKLLGLQIIKSITGILILLAFDPQKSFDILKNPLIGAGEQKTAYSFEIHHNYHQKLRLFSFYGLSSIIASIVIISLILSYVIPARLPSSYAATFTKTWTSQTDFENNAVTGQGTTTRTNVDTASSTGDVKLSTVGIDQTFTESFTTTTNIDTANSADNGTGVSGGQLQLATGTATDLSSFLSGSATWMNIATDTFDRVDNTNIATGSSIAWVERAGNWDILSNRLNLNTASTVAVAQTGTMPVADYTVQAIVNSATTAAQEGIVGRRVNFGTDDSNGYFLHIQPGTGLNLQKRVSGVWTSLGSFAATINTGTDYTIKLSMQGSTIKGFLAGVERVSVVDTSITAAGDAGIKAENVGFKADDFTVDFIASPDVKSMARASNGDIYIGGDVGRFGKYTPGTNTFTDLSPKISSIWGTTRSVFALTFDSTNNMVYLGGNNGKFAKCTVTSPCDGANGNATDLSAKTSGIFGASDMRALTFDSTNNVVYLSGSGSKFAKCATTSPCDGANGNATDLTAKISGILGTSEMRALTFNSTNNMVYLGTEGGKFARCTPASPCDGTNGNVTDLTAKISAFWSTNAVRALTFDTTNNVVYLGGVSGKFAKCATASACDGANGNATDLTAKISGFFSTNNINALTFDSTNNVVYMGGLNGKFAKCATESACDGANGNATDLTAKISGFWSTGVINALAYDSTNNLIYLGGLSGRFAKFTAVGNTQSVQSVAVDSLATNIAYATLTKNDTPGTGSVTYQLSNNSSTFNTITLGTRYDFTTNGSSLKWKITLTGNATVQDITIVYNGYNATGTITNLKTDALGDVQWTTISWTASTPSGILIKFRTRGATNAQGAGALSTALWSPYYTSSGAAITNELSAPNPVYRYFEIEMFLDSGTTSGSQTPTLNDFTVTYAQNGLPDFSAITGVSQNNADGKITVNFSIRDTDSNTGSTTPGKVNLSLEYCANAPACSIWTAAATITGDVGLKQVCDGSGSNGGLNCPLTQYTAYSITWTPTTDYTNQYSNSYKVRIKANDAEAINNLATAESNTFEFDTKTPILGSPAVKIDGTTNNLTLSATDDNLQNPQKQMDIAVDCASLTGNWINYSTPYDATSLIGAANPKTVCIRFRDYYKNTTANTLTSTSSAPTNLLIQDTTNKAIGQYQMFISWGVVASAAKYHIYRSTDNFFSRTEVGTIISPSAPNTNYFTDTNFLTTSTAPNYFGNTFSYRITAEDASGNESAYSETKSGIPDGNTQASEGGGTGGGGAQTGDTTPPTISSVNVKDITDTTAKITWATNEISNSVVNYGFDLGMTNQEVVSSFVITHEVLLTGLTPNRSYLYKVSSTDASNNTKINNNNGQGYLFATLKQETDIVAPKIFNINIQSASTSAKITWETDEDSSSYLDYGLAGKDYSKTLGKDEIAKQHSINITGLNPETNYHFIAYSFDKSKNRGASEDLTFKTLSISKDETVLDELQKFLASGDKEAYDNLKKTIDEAAKNLPTPKIIGDLPKIETTSTTAKISWVTDVLSNSIVALAPASLYPVSSNEPYIMTVGNFEEKTINHEVFIPNLAPSTLYHYQLRSKPVFGPEGRSNDLTFSTKSLTPEIFGEQIRKISQNQATIIWSTNIQSDSVIRYTPYRNGKPNLAETKLQGKPDLMFDHEITLLSLEYGTLYDIEIQSTDKLNNNISKKLKPFSTSIDLEAPQISQIRTESAVVPGGREQVQTIIFWKTNEPATSQVIYQEGITEDKSKEKTTAEDNNLTQNHVVVITSFKAGQVYRFKVKSKDSFGNPIESVNFTILAPRQKESIIQIITKNFEETFGFLKKLKF